MNDISPVKIDIKADLTNPINKIVDTAVAPVIGTYKGITKIISACSGKWFANRERQIELIVAQTAKDVEDVKSGKKEYRNDELLKVELAPTTADYYRQVSEHNGACDAKRLEAVMLTAAIELFNTPEEEISDEPLNQTFFNHWRAEAELIDEEDLRKWWAHLLVEETKKPNSISPRTLDVAKNLSRKEAEIFLKNIAYAYAGGLIQKSDHQTIASSLSEIIVLQDAGLVMTSEFMQSSLNDSCDINNAGKYTCMVFSDSRIAVAFKAEKISFSCYVLTTAGNELYKMFKKVESLEEIKSIAQEVAKQNNNAEYVVYPISHIDKNNDGTTTYQLTLTPVRSSATDNGDPK